jgi:hypothetical protein
MDPVVGSEELADPRKIIELIVATSSDRVW